MFSKHFGPHLAFLAALSSATLCAQTLPLVPAPREARFTTALSLANGVQIACKSCDAEDTFAANDLTRALTERGVAVGHGPVTITLARTTSAEGKQALASAPWQTEMNEEGYIIVSTSSGLTIVGASASGVFYGAQTAKQLVDTASAQPTLHLATIRDWPSLKIRGLDDDLSRGPVPTLEYQKKQIRILATYKVNLYSPYFEHTFQYLSHPLMSPPGGTLTQAEARELVAYAAQYHITVVPEQEAFGHLHYLLNWEKYAQLSETPHGQVLAPGQPGSLQVTKDMFTELANVFPSPYLHLGADETFELGRGQTKADVDARGLGAVYLDYMKRIVAELQPLHRKLLFWGDIAMHDPDLVKALPTDFKRNTIAIAWEYNPQPRGYSRWIKPFTDAGMECWVAPGINNWSRVYPNYNYALTNIHDFTQQGKAAGCAGQLNTIWNDDGEGLPNADWYGILFGAAAAWQLDSGNMAQYQSSYGRTFHNDATGKIDEAQREMMAAHALLKDNFKKSDGSDLLFWIDPWSKDGQGYASLLRPYLSGIRLHAERAIVLVREARSSGNLRETDALDALELGARRMDLLAFKFQLSDEIATLYATAEKAQYSNVKEIKSSVGASLGAINGVNGKLQDLRDGYSLTRDLYQQSWLSSTRPYWMQNVLQRYDMTMQLWLSRSDQLRSAQRQWSASQTLPTAESLGIPPSPTPVVLPAGGH